MKTKLNTPYVQFLLKDDLLIATYKKGLQIDVKTAKQIVRSRLSFTDGKTLPVLIMDEGVISINKEARDYMASEEATSYVKAAAIVMSSSVSAMLGRFLVAMHKTDMPVKLFWAKGHALRWLNKFCN